MDRLGGAFDRVASGHYAQIAQCEEGFYLQRAPDPVKDQTYFLSNLHQEQLAHLLFPIGHLPKLEVRTLQPKRLPYLLKIGKTVRAFVFWVKSTIETLSHFTWAEGVAI